jgi:zinc transporter 7
MQATTIAAFLSTTIISLAPNALLFLFPTYRPETTSDINPLAIGQALAAGGLLGDVFLHTLPHEMNHENGQVIGLAILAGFLAFLLFDILVRSYGHECHENHDHKKKDVKFQVNKTWTSAAILNLAADSLHNFTDGIAIGASFAGSSYDDSLLLVDQVKTLIRSRGGLATLAVLFHEIPHELGDYSILVSSGFSKMEAIKTQFVTAVAAYCGTFVGLYGMTAMKEILGNDLMIPFTAGGFLYLSSVTILPELLQKKVSRRARMTQIVAFCIGIGFMYMVGVLEHAGDGCGHDHGHVHHIDHGADGRHIHSHSHEHFHSHSHEHFHDHSHDHEMEDHHHAEEASHHQEF